MAKLNKVFVTNRQTNLSEGVNKNIYPRAQEVNPIIDRLNSITDTDNELTVDTIEEYTAANGVTVDGVLLKDSTVLTGAGVVGTPSVQVGSADTGLYEVSATQTGFSQDGTLVAVFDSNGINPDACLPRVQPGTAGAGCTALTYGDGKNFTTEITLTSPTIAIAGAAAEGNGVLVYTFPAGAHVHETTYMDIDLQGTGTVDADTPEVGIGSVIATGAVSILSGTATFEDYITGQVAADVNGTNTVALTAATAGYGTGISLNVAASAKTLHLNVADTWAGADTITATGTVVVKWTQMA